MKNKTIHVNSYEIGYLLTQQHALIRLVSIILTFQFFLCLSLLLLGASLLKILPFAPLEHIGLVLSIFGLSPFGLTVLAWRGIEKLCSFYIRRYIDKNYKT